MRGRANRWSRSWELELHVVADIVPTGPVGIAGAAGTPRARAVPTVETEPERVVVVLGADAAATAVAGALGFAALAHCTQGGDAHGSS